MQIGTAATVGDFLVPSGAGAPAVERMLHAVRQHLGLAVAYVSQFVGDESVFRAVDAPGLSHLIEQGDRRSLDDVYCRHILDGRIPELMPDTATVPLAAAMPITAAIPIGAHLSVPLRLPSGDLYGMFCCLGPAADPSLNTRDLATMRAFADLAAFEIDRTLDTDRRADEKRARVSAALAGDALAMVYQPIWHIGRNAVIGYESLSRFRAEPIRTPDLWFAEAAEVGLDLDLELMAIRRGLSALDALDPATYVAVNASPRTAMSGRLHSALSGLPLHRIVLEITEHDNFADFDLLLAALCPLRARGLRIAIDDAGAGYSGLQRVLQIRPDVLKLDRFRIKGIAGDPGRKALAAALLGFAGETGSTLVAEGVETAEELAMLRSLGVNVIQGYLLGRPQPLATLLSASVSVPGSATRLHRNAVG